MLECAINEAIGYSTEIGFWTCIPAQDLSAGCPGDYQNDCEAAPEDFDPQCVCPEERWMNFDCTEAYICQDEEPIVCEGGQVVSNLIIGDAINEDVRCIDVDESLGCPGSYHLGCNGISKPV